MKDDPASLSHLHDLVPPAEVAWWPLAPGWYIVAVLLLLVGGWLGLRAWRYGKATAYRREALRELRAISDSESMIRILRRTALVLAPRAEIAGLSGQAWVDWVAARAPGPLPEYLREELASGVYRRASEKRDSAALRDYIESWILYQEAVQTLPRKEAEC